MTALLFCLLKPGIAVRLTGKPLVQESTFMAGKGDPSMSWDILHELRFMFNFNYHISKFVEKVAEEVNN